MPQRPNYSGKIMNQREELDQLLSAYFDGELVRDEHSHADAALKDAENQRVVEEYERLHESIQALPTRRLRSEFSHDLVAEIDRQKRTQLSGASRWQRAILVIASTAAAALLMWAIIGRNQKGSTADSEDGQQDGSSAVVAKDDKQPDKSPTKKDEVTPTKDAPKALVNKDERKDPIIKKSPQLVKDGTKKQPGPLEKKSPKLPFATKFVFTFEIVLSDSGARNQTLERLFARNGIAFQPDLKVGDELEKDLLKSRMLKKVVGKKSKGKDQVQLIYVLADPNNVDPLWRELRRQPGQIVEMKYNIVMAREDMAPFEQLKRTERDNFAKLQEAKKELAKHSYRARRLAFNLTLFSDLVRSQATTGVLRSGKSSAPVPSPFAPIRVLDSGKGKKGAPHDFKARQKATEILFIVHRVPPKK